MSNRKSYSIRVKPVEDTTEMKTFIKLNTAEETEQKMIGESKTDEEPKYENVVMHGIQLPRGNARTTKYKQDIRNFSEQLKILSDKIGFKMSARGWCYALEGFGIINKDQFKEAQDVINKCRKNGLLPVDFVAGDKSREFSGVEIPEDKSTQEWTKELFEQILESHQYYTPDWWKDEKYYIQMVVEKVDLQTLFSPVCALFKIPIATSKGWSSVLQRATYARRFKEAEDKGLICVLLYCGDHDPIGLEISEKLRDNLAEVKGAMWSDGFEGYDPKDLIIDRFGLNFEFIENNNLSWIPNLITGSGKNLANPEHKFYNRASIQDYLARYGERKCEANAIVVQPERAQLLCLDAIEKYLGGPIIETIKRFQAKREALKEAFDTIRKDVNIEKPLKDAIEKLEKSIA